MPGASDGWLELASGGQVLVEGGRPVRVRTLDSEDVPADLDALHADVEAALGVRVRPFARADFRPGEGRCMIEADVSRA